MKTNLALTLLGTRIKLFRRHMREYSDLLVHQRQLKQLTHEEINSQKPSCTDLGMRKQRILQANRLAQLDERQVIERQELQVRQQQEEADLEQILKIRKLNPSVQTEMLPKYC